MTDCAMADDNDGLEDELELLSAMWSENELKIKRSPAEDASAVKASLTARLMPLTAGDQGLQHLWCEVHLEVPPDYPEEALLIALGASRGLSDQSRCSMLQYLQKISHQLLGGPALHGILEAASEELTKLNSTPSGDCAICLASLSETPVLEGKLQLQDMQDATAARVCTPCFHVFHYTCLMECWKSCLAKTPASQCDPLLITLACPECRCEIQLAAMPQFQSVISRFPEPESISVTDIKNEEKEAGGYCDDAKPMVRSLVSDTETSTLQVQPEAFIRLHHLHHGNDPKEKPLLRLLKELRLNATVYYGKPALLHIQGEASDVDAFAGTAKRRHITITIDVALRQSGPAIDSGITAIPAKKGSLDSVTLKTHLDGRKLGETQFTIIGP
mmetsp:Transcript_83208/g.147001  ORF Transcript_83208/g.147001 Transcript_83208/m.147001 type:complete len:388 (-) Transcript_83208:167-1330(-)|eukprot:CAMPEP_0197622416 /NCGR_PEP_ID=MMETSP1338-20131121/2740_1 /TAXON_ID=43686 ORGANISM="Pelagodinium beii, Strain RCC1491" /NCGR_SAMPLE_ID=MMETSP1338 /ASSEMBLY_ACC=CAM_ASM_000754 /LENGTH=387 /DNA_ID=CAMNT_0043192149 /DNA_START=50 /DNA_END=1213 /DNA_ORIENTATION=-